MARKKAAKSKSNNPDGRPKEYREQMRTLSIALPEYIVQKLDRLSEEVGSSRQRLLVEWMTIASMLESQGHLSSTAEGTFFEQFPTRPVIGENFERHPQTYAEAAKLVARYAEETPDAYVRGVEFWCFRDQVQHQKFMGEFKERARELQAKTKDPAPS